MCFHWHFPSPQESTGYLLEAVLTGELLSDEAQTDAELQLRSAHRC